MPYADFKLLTDYMTPQLKSATAPAEAILQSCMQQLACDGRHKSYFGWPPTSSVCYVRHDTLILV